MSHQFPIQSLPPLKVSDLEHQACREFMQELLIHTIREFEFHSYYNRGIVDTRRWKPQTHRDHIELYRERKVGVTGGTLLNSARHCRLDLPLFSSTAETLASPTMLLSGYGHGRVEDAMSAVVTESQHDFALAVKFEHQDVADCAILKTLEPPIQSDPYHYLGLKFFVRKSPTEGHLLKHRHSVYLEFSGVTHSSKGEQLGFHLMHSVELPRFTDLSNYNSIRALQSTRYIYRQKSSNVVEVFMLGNMDVSGRILKPLAKMLTVDTLFGVTRLLELAEVRRLSQMAHKQRNFGTNAAVLGKSPACNVCSSKHKLLHCNLCGDDACKKCTSYKRVFVGDNSGILGHFVKVPACKTCVRQANTGTFTSPHRRVLRTSPSDLKFDFHKPRAEAPQDAESKTTVRSPGRRRGTFPCESFSMDDPTQYATSLPAPSKLSQQSKEEDQLANHSISPTKWYSDQRVDDAGATSIRPRSRTRASISDQTDTSFPSVHRNDLMAANMLPAERAMMTRLFELSKIAEDASATARQNGIYCKQHW